MIEHIAYPKELLKRWKKMLDKDGLLAIMTKRVTNQEAFQQWHYKNDPTHICFYSESTFKWVAEEYGFELEIVDKDVVFLKLKRN